MVHDTTHSFFNSPETRPPCTGVILAGGLNIRFNRKNKALAIVGKEKILDNTLRVFRALFDDIILVTNTPLLFAEWDVAIATDIYPVRSPLTGIHTGLLYAQTPHIFVAACDIPFLKRDLVATILAGIDSRADVFIPATSKGLEPLCAAYSKKCLVHIERLILGQMASKPKAAPPTRRILKKSLKIQNFFQQVRVKKITEKELRAQDPNLFSFFNVNTPEDLNQALAMLSGTPEES